MTTAATPPLAPLPPTAGLLASVLVSAWVDITPPGAVAFLLLAHPPARRRGDSRSVIQAQMRGLGAALGLAPASEELPDMGSRLIVRGSTAAVLRIDRCAYVLRVPVPAAWARFVAGGGTVVVSVGLDALARGSDRGAVEEYLTESASTDRLLMGKAHVRPSGGWRHWTWTPTTHGPVEDPRTT